MVLGMDRGKQAVFSLWPGFVLGLVFWLTGPIQPASADTSPRVVIVLSDSALPYHQVADAFIAALAGKYPVQVKVLGEMRESEIKALNSEKVLIVPVGVRALHTVHGDSRHDAQILSLLVPRAALLLLNDGGVDDAAVYLDQTPARSLAFARLLVPNAKRVGIIMSKEAAMGLRAFVAEAVRAKLEVVTNTVQEQNDVPSALQTLLPQIDVLLLVPDSLVVNESTVRQILMASYRRRVPVIGFSRGLTNAGAVASLVSGLEEIGRQGGLLARQWNPVAGTLPAARYPGQFEMTFNRQVARSLDITLPIDEQELAAWREKLE
ncbi:MAG: ABC transporter substrate binding protein [Hydrogenophilaceae bacterium]